LELEFWRSTYECDSEADVKELDKILGGAGILGLIRSDLGKRVLGPLADEAGQALATVGEIYRFYQNEQLGKIFKKWDAQRKGKQLTEDDLKKIMPLLQLASVQSEDELQDRWAELLENTVSQTQGVLPSFGETLSQITAEEARFLDRLYDVATQPLEGLPVFRSGLGPFSRVNLIDIYDPSIQTGMNPAEREIFEGRLSEEQIENYDRLGQAELVIQDLIRLGILSESQSGEVDPHIPSEDGIMPAGPFDRSPVYMRPVYSLSHYGVAFVKAVRPRNDD
jgi:hypothetical protein